MIKTFSNQNAFQVAEIIETQAKKQFDTHKYIQGGEPCSIWAEGTTKQSSNAIN